MRVAANSSAAGLIALTLWVSLAFILSASGWKLYNSTRHSTSQSEMRLALRPRSLSIGATGVNGW